MSSSDSSSSSSGLASSALSRSITSSGSSTTSSSRRGSTASTSVQDQVIQILAGQRLGEKTSPHRLDGDACGLHDIGKLVGRDLNSIIMENQCSVSDRKFVNIRGGSHDDEYAGA